jgi:hypothetical protein
MWAVLAGIVGINLYAYWTKHGHPWLQKMKEMWDNTLIVAKKPASAPAVSTPAPAPAPTSAPTPDNTKEGMCGGREKCDPEALSEAVQKNPHADDPSNNTGSFVAMGAKPPSAVLAPF